MKRNSGFSMVELLVVLAIIGIIAAIAIPEIQAFRAKAYDADAESTLRNVATAEEAYFVETTSYVSCDQSNCASFLSGVPEIDSNITLEITATTSGFTGVASHRRGSKSVGWDTSAGGFQK